MRWIRYSTPGTQVLRTYRAYIFDFEAVLGVLGPTGTRIPNTRFVRATVTAAVSLPRRLSRSLHSIIHSLPGYRSAHSPAWNKINTIETQGGTRLSDQQPAASSQLQPVQHTPRHSLAIGPRDTISASWGVSDIQSITTPQGVTRHRARTRRQHPSFSNIIRAERKEIENSANSLFPLAIWLFPNITTRAFSLPCPWPIDTPRPLTLKSHHHRRQQLVLPLSNTYAVLAVTADAIPLPAQHRSRLPLASTAAVPEHHRSLCPARIPSTCKRYVLCTCALSRRRKRTSRTADPVDRGQLAGVPH